MLSLNDLKLAVTTCQFTGLGSYCMHVRAPLIRLLTLPILFTQKDTKALILSLSHEIPLASLLAFAFSSPTTFTDKRVLTSQRSLEGHLRQCPAHVNQDQRQAEADPNP